jgi:hypothetical protein
MDLVEEIVQFAMKHGTVKTMQLVNIALSAYDNTLSQNLDGVSIVETGALDDAMKTLNEWCHDHETT